MIYLGAVFNEAINCQIDRLKYVLYQLQQNVTIENVKVLRTYLYTGSNQFQCTNYHFYFLKRHSYLLEECKRQKFSSNENRDSRNCKYVINSQLEKSLRCIYSIVVA
jgi:hypothetical protein